MIEPPEMELCCDHCGRTKSLDSHGEFIGEACWHCGIGYWRVRPSASVPPEPPTLSDEREARLRFLQAEFATSTPSGKYFDRDEMLTLRDDLDALMGTVAALRAELADASADAERSDALHRRRYENIATALGRRYPTAEEIVAAAITFIDTARAASGEDTSR